MKEENSVIQIPVGEESKHSLSIQILKRMYQQIKKLEKTKEVRVVLLTSPSKDIFSSGLDLRQIYHKVHFITKMNVLRSVWWVYRINRAITKSKKIYVAAMDGAVIGSAVSIVMACDFRYASNRTWFWLPDPQYGGLLGDGGIELLRANCNVTATKEIALTNQRFDATWAKRVGFVHEVTKEEITSYAKKQSKKFLQYSFKTLYLTKRICNKHILHRFPLILLMKAIWSKEMKIRLNGYMRHV